MLFQCVLDHNAKAAANTIDCISRIEWLKTAWEMRWAQGSALASECKAFSAATNSRSV